MDFTDIKRFTVDDKRAVQLEIDGETVWRGLPRGYTELDYIEVTGTQYIDTGFVPNQDTRIVCEFMYLGGNGVYGARYSTSSRNFCMRAISSKWQAGYNNKLGSSNITTDTTKWHIADQNKNIFYIDGVLGFEFEYAEFTAPKSIILGGINANNSVYYGEGRYRACRIYDNGTLVRSLIPCKNPNGVIGMYDTVNAKFYSNAGSGEFIAGAEWNGLPVGYKQLDYIETTGIQLIDTEFIPNQDTRVVCEFMFRGASSSGSRDIYGVRKSISTDMYWLRVISSKWQPAYNNVLGGTEIATDTTNWHIADQNKNIFYMDEVLGYEFEYAEFTCPMSLYLGGGQSPYNGYSRYYGKARYRSCKIYDNDVLVRDFVACKTSDGRIGMYDKLNGKFHGNVGTGEFVAGAEL